MYGFILVLISLGFVVIGIHSERNGEEFSHFWILSIFLMFLAYLFAVFSNTPVV